VSRLQKNDRTCHVYPGAKPFEQEWEVERVRMTRWLGKLPKPVAIFAANDMRARQVLDACLRADIRVPYEAAVLGVDNDPLICETCIPSLSSIRLDVEAAGYVAAELLDKRMFGGRDTRRETKRIELHWALGTHYSKRFRTVTHDPWGHPKTHEKDRG